MPEPDEYIEQELVGLRSRVIRLDDAVAALAAGLRDKLDRLRELLESRQGQGGAG